MEIKEMAELVHTRFSKEIGTFLFALSKELEGIPERPKLKNDSEALYSISAAERHIYDLLRPIIDRQAAEIVQLKMELDNK